MFTPMLIYLFVTTVSGPLSRNGDQAVVKRSGIRFKNGNQRGRCYTEELHVSRPIWQDRHSSYCQCWLDSVGNASYWLETVWFYVNPRRQDRVKLTSIRAQITGNWKYKSWIKSDSGTFNTRISDASIALSISFDVDKNGKLKFAKVICSSVVNGVGVKLSDPGNWLNKKISEMAVNKIKEMSKTEICQMVTQTIQEKCNHRASQPAFNCYAQQNLKNRLWPLFQTIHKLENDCTLS